MAIDLGTSRKLLLRDYFEGEEREFTPWLAENIGRLGDALGLELEVDEVEPRIGPYSADLTAQDASGGSVVIENQFGKTDHDHLGKVLTYAAYREAKIVVWIAEQFSDEHRKTIDWLNERLSTELNLYAVEVELWRIDESKPALRFNVLNPSKQPPPTPPEGAKKTQLEFWAAFRQNLLAKKIVATAQAARPQYWFDIGLGRANIHLSNIANTQEGRIGVRVYIGNKVASG